MTRLRAVALALVVALVPALAGAPSAGAATSRPVAPPPAVETFAAVPAWGTYGNTVIADCSVAAVGDIIQTWEGSGPVGWPQLIHLYRWAVGGIAHESDGATPGRVLAYWKRHRVDGYQLASWAEIPNYRARLAIERAVALDGAVYAVVTVPALDAENFSVGVMTPWTLAGVPKGSPPYGPHAAALVGYDATGPYLVTWGTVVHVTWAWWETWATAAYTVTP